MPIPADPAQMIAVLGAAGALLYVLKLIVDGKLHSNSEVEGLRQDKKDLLAINAILTSAIDKSNDQLTMIIEMLGSDARVDP
jgi:DUF1009 family protein